MRSKRVFQTGVFAAMLVTSMMGAGCADQRPGVGEAGRNATIEPVPPNIVVFLIDALRADRLNCYGYEDRVTSPRMDELASDAVLFENAYSPAPWTLPSVVSIFTSSHLCEHGVLTDREKLPRSVTTLAEYLHDRGYTTIGLYGNGYAGPDFGLDQGFDHYKFSRKNDGLKVSKMFDDATEGPFFLYIHNMEPHGGERYSGPPAKGYPEVTAETRLELRERSDQYRKLTRRDFARGLTIGSTDNTEQQIQELDFMSETYEENSILYDAAVQLADSRVGSVIDWLQGTERWENTVFILISDHGEELGDHGGWQHDQSVYEELVRVPLIVRLPMKHQAEGERVDSIVSLVDLFPTIAWLVEPDRPLIPGEFSGQSLLPHHHEETGQPDSDFSIPTLRINRKKYFRPWKESRGDINVVIRRGSQKGILNIELGDLELYDLSSDPGEQLDLSADMVELSKEMVLAGEQWFQGCSEDGAVSSSLSDATKEQLKALGYVD